MIMRKLLLLLTMVVLAATVFAQESADKFQTPEFGYKVREYYTVDVEGADRDTTWVNTFLMATEYRYNGDAIAYFDTYVFQSDSTIINEIRRQRAAFPLNVEVTGGATTQTVKEWIEQTLTPADSAVWLNLGRRLARYSKIGEAVGE